MNGFRRPLLFFLGLFILLFSCEEDINPIVGYWRVGEVKANNILVPLNTCTSQSEITVTSQGENDGYLMRTTYFFDSVEMICDSWVSRDQFGGTYGINDGSIIELNKKIELTENDHLIYYSDYWDFIYDSLGGYDTLIATPMIYLYSRVGN